MFECSTNIIEMLIHNLLLRKQPSTTPSPVIRYPTQPIFVSFLCQRRFLANLPWGFICAFGPHKLTSLDQPNMAYKCLPTPTPTTTTTRTHTHNSHGNNVPVINPQDGAIAYYNRWISASYIPLGGVTIYRRCRTCVSRGLRSTLQLLD